MFRPTDFTNLQNHHRQDDVHFQRPPKELPLETGYTTPYCIGLGEDKALQEYREDDKYPIKDCWNFGIVFSKVAGEDPTATGKEEHEPRTDLRQCLHPLYFLLRDTCFSDCLQSKVVNVYGPFEER